MCVEVQKHVSRTMVWMASILSSTVMPVGWGNANSDGFSCDIKDPPVARLRDAIGGYMAKVVQEPRDREGRGLGGIL